MPKDILLDRLEDTVFRRNDLKRQIDEMKRPKRGSHEWYLMKSLKREMKTLGKESRRLFSLQYGTKDTRQIAVTIDRAAVAAQSRESPHIFGR